MKRSSPINKIKASGIPGKPLNGRSGDTGGSVVQQVNNIIHTAIEAEVSDIHLEPYDKEFRIRYRLDGVLQRHTLVNPKQKDAVISRLKIMAKLDIAEKRRPQDGRIRIEYKNRGIDLRVSTLPTEFGEKIVLRILDKQTQQLDLEALGFDSGHLSSFRRAINYPYGLVLVTGPTGSGKTTTLYAGLNERNTESVNITTIEDPIEYNLHGINQTQVRSDIGLTFSHALRSILRQDPDIIMVGEIRDRETAEIAIRAALTGHLVFSTLHTNDAPSAVARLLDMGVEPFLLASSIRLVMAQRLVRKICSSCSTEYHSDDRSFLKEHGLQNRSGTVKMGKGCDHCLGTGYHGRTALMELMPATEEITALISGEAGTSVLRDHAIQAGMTTLKTAGLEKIKLGLTTPEEVMRETV